MTNNVIRRPSQSRFDFWNKRKRLETIIVN